MKMKLFFNIFLSLVLMIGQAGVGLHFHYCSMKEKRNISINDIKPASSCCKKANSSSCCKHTYKFVQLKDHLFCASDFKLAKPILAISLIHYTNFIENVYKNNKVEYFYTDSSPPLYPKTPVFISNRTLLI
jgi:hypothetical protein